MMAKGQLSALSLLSIENEMDGKWSSATLLNPLLHQSPEGGSYNLKQKTFV